MRFQHPGLGDDGSGIRTGMREAGVKRGALPNLEDLDNANYKFLPLTKWTTTLSSKVNLHRTIKLGASSGGSLVTYHADSGGNETRVTHRVDSELRTQPWLGVKRVPARISVENTLFPCGWRFVGSCGSFNQGLFTKFLHCLLCGCLLGTTPGPSNLNQKSIFYFDYFWR